MKFNVDGSAGGAPSPLRGDGIFCSNRGLFSGALRLILVLVMLLRMSEGGFFCYLLCLV